MEKEQYHNLILSIVASATLADHMGDMWDDLNDVLVKIGEKDLTEEFHELPKKLAARGIRTVNGIDIGTEEAE